MSSSIERLLSNPFCTLFYQKGRDYQRKKINPGQRLLELSEQERYQALHDLHGVSDEIKETPELVDNCIQELEEELRMLSDQHNNNNNNNSYYRKAYQMSPSYVKAQYLRFLRAKSFQPHETALLLERFFELKSRLFGDSKLVQDIKMTDLTPQDIQYWKTGYQQCLPQRDLAGRRILFFVGRLVQEIPIESTIRINFVLTATKIDEEDQKRGLVMVYYGLDQHSFQKDLPFQFAAVRECLPYRTVANHFAYDNPYLHQFMPVVEVAMAIIEQCRFRTHFGTHLEVQYDLMTFGLTRESFPISAEDGSIDLGMFRRTASDLFEELRLLQVVEPAASSLSTKEGNITADITTTNNNNSKGVGRTARTMSTTSRSSTSDNDDEKKDDNNEASSSSSSSCYLPPSFVPGPNDVIMGRGANHSPGNVQLRRLLGEYRDQYDRATFRMEKMVVNHHVYTFIKKDLGGKFVNWNKKVQKWEEVSDETAREKISLGFRNMRRQPAAAVNNNNNNNNNNHHNGKNNGNNSVVVGRSTKRRARG